MDGGAWWATVHGVAKSRTGLSDFTSSAPGRATSDEDFCEPAASGAAPLQAATRHPDNLLEGHSPATENSFFFQTLNFLFYIKV